MRSLANLFFTAVTLLLPFGCYAQTTAEPPVQFGATQAAVGQDSGQGAASPMASLGPPAILWLRGQGVSVEDLGSAHGLEGWLAMRRDVNNQPLFQVFYTTPDGQGLVAGVMFDEHGKDLTGLQIADTTEGKGMISGNAAPSSASPPISHAQTVAPPVAPAPAASNPSASVAAPETNLAEQVPEEVLSKYFVPLGVNESEFQAIMKSEVASFRVGDATAPDLILVADPHCPYCHKAWQYLAPLVTSHQIAVTVVLIHGLPEMESPEKDAVAVLSNPNAAEAWLNGVGSVDGVAIPSPTSPDAMKRGQKLLNANDAFASNMQVVATPTVFWYQDGQTYRGQTLGGVMAFMQAVSKGKVGS